ncbi:LuxR C-terminal-related transcriptional regulator [Methylobacterium sp. Gmos1]
MGIKDSMHNHITSSSIDGDNDITVSEKNTDSNPSICIIDNRKMLRDCLEKCLVKAFGSHIIATFASIDEWDQSAVSRKEGDVVILCCDARETVQSELERNNLLSRNNFEVRIAILCDSEDLGDVVEYLNKGASGYIPTSVSLNVAIEAIRLVQAGGIFVPASSVFQHCKPGEPAVARSQFTPRQSAVLERLQTGRSNKIIAFDLKMKESTVKVHVRNIMRRLGVSNRTQAVIETYNK